MKKVGHDRITFSQKFIYFCYKYKTRQPLRDFSDNYLVNNIKNNDRMAFTMIFEKYHRNLYAFALKYTRNDDLARDTVQHTFLKLWEKRSKLNPELNLQGYIFRTARNHILNLIRNNASANLGNMEYYLDFVVETDAAAKTLERSELLSLLNSSILKLPPQRAAICRLKIGDGLSNREIAERLNISVNTVKHQYSISIKQLRKIMGAGISVIMLLNILTSI